MADPDVRSELDALDHLSVLLYRCGLVVVAIALLAQPVPLALRPAAVVWPSWAVQLGVAVCAANLHLYDRRFRWFLPLPAWLGLAVSAAPFEGAWASELANHVGHGLSLVTVSAIALKENLCFRIPGARAVPWVLCVGAVSRPWLPQVSGVMMVIGGVLVALIAASKLQQPLDYDIGDRSKYQV
ncbi:MAG TPA: DUF2301 domain-containing membrane protein [Myxococcota bacterium]|nr:DUF2301 domain-containing membrane protein [Myxococcota bacterium]